MIKKAYDWFIKPKHTLLYFLLISLIFAAVLFLIFLFIKCIELYDYASFILGIISVILSTWTIFIAFKIKEHVNSKVRLNEFRELRKKWYSKKLTEKYVDEEELNNAKRIIANAIADKDVIEESIINEVKKFSDIVNKEKVYTYTYLGALDSVISIINNM